MSIDIRIKAEVHLEGDDRFDLPAREGDGKVRVHYLTYEPGSDNANLYALRVYKDGIRTEKNGKPVGMRSLSVLPIPLAEMLRAL